MDVHGFLTTSILLMLFKLARTAEVSGPPLHPYTVTPLFYKLDAKIDGKVTEGQSVVMSASLPGVNALNPFFLVAETG